MTTSRDAAQSSHAGAPRRSVAHVAARASDADHRPRYYANRCKVSVVNAGAIPDAIAHSPIVVIRIENRLVVSGYDPNSWCNHGELSAAADGRCAVHACGATGCKCGPEQ